MSQSNPVVEGNGSDSATRIPAHTLDGVNIQSKDTAEEISQDSSAKFADLTVFQKSRVDYGDTIVERLYLPKSGSGKWVKYVNGKLFGGIKGPWTRMPESWSLGKEIVIEIFRETCFTDLSEESVGCMNVYPNSRITVLYANPRAYFCIDASYVYGASISSVCRNSEGMFH